MTPQDVITLAAAHSLFIDDTLHFNEMGIDFQVAFATDQDGQKWVLRIPRRTNLGPQIEKEHTILKLAQKYLSIGVPDWKIATPELVAYPLLEDPPVLTFDAKTYAVTWHMEQENHQLVETLAPALVQLHQIPVSEASALGLPVKSAAQARADLHTEIAQVKEGLGLPEALERRWLTWLDNDALWPGFSTFIHGDLYAGHILASKQGQVSGMIDWSEAQVGDPSIDFAGHLTVFGEDSLRDLITVYERLGGQVWDTLFAQTVERQAASALKYAVFALTTQDEGHLQGAKAQLGLT